MWDNFWLRPDPHGRLTHPPLNDKMLAETEDALGVRLPRSYVNLLRRLNGGYPQRTMCFDVLLGIPVNPQDQTDFDKDNIARRDKIIAYELPGEFVPFTWDNLGNHTFDCFDYRECGPRGNPQVVTVNIEPLTDYLDGTEEMCNGCTIDRIGESFAEYKKKFRYTNDYSVYGVHGNPTLPDITDAVRETLPLALDDSGEAMYLQGPGEFGEQHLTTQLPHYTRHLSAEAGLLALQSNVATDGYWDFPAAKDCTWIIQVDIGKKHRDEFERELAKLPWKVRRLYQPWG